MKRGATMTFVYAAAGMLMVSLLGLQALKYSDSQEVKSVWQSLSDYSELTPQFFKAEMVADLPDPARRYFLFTIEPGTPLHTVAEIKMTGEIGLGTKEKPNYMPMEAHQILAPPYGLVWKLKAGSGLMKMTGSDGYLNNKAWVRFWLLNSIPIVRAGGTSDYIRASLGRVVAEAVFWAPATLLPQKGVVWETVAKNKAKATIEHNGIHQELEITVAEDGMPVSVVIPRWSNENPEKKWRLQPFGGTLSDFKRFDGFNISTQVDGGNHYGADKYFPFYRAKVENIHFQ